MGEVGATVVLTLDGQTLTGTVDASGNWTFTSPTLADGIYTASVTLIDALGNTSTTDSVVFTIDSTAPAAPTLSSPTDGSTITNTTPDFIGTAESGATITVTTNGGTPVCTAVADSSGNWSCTPTTPLAEGVQNIVITPVDVNGNTGTALTAAFRIDTTAPAAPTLTAVGGDTTAPYATSMTAPVISGTAEAGSTITVRDGSGNTLGTAAVDASGNWSLTVAPALVDGTHTLSITATDAVGNTSAPTSALITVDSGVPTASVTSVGGDTTAPYTTTDSTPDIILSTEAGITVTAPGYTCTPTPTDASGIVTCTPLSTLTDGTHTVVVSLTDSVGNTGTASVTLVVDANAPLAPVVTAVDTDTSAPYATADATPTITGTGEAGTIISLKNASGTVLGTGTVDASGKWTISLTTELTDGTYTYFLNSTDVLGNTSPATTLVFALSTVPGPGGGGGGSSSVPASTPAPVTNEATPQKSLPIIDTTKKDTAKDTTIPKDATTPKDTNTTSPEQSLLPSQSLVTPAGENKTGEKIYTLKSPLTDYICPQIVQVYSEDEIKAQDIPGLTQTDSQTQISSQTSSSLFSDDIKSVIMFRGLEKDEQMNGQTFEEYKKFGIAINDNAFEPTRNVTRAEYVKMLVRALSCRYQKEGTNTPFSDVDENMWYAEYINFATNHGWINGYEDGTFRPNAPITRAEAAKILANAIQLQKGTQDSSFSDVPSSSVFTPYIEALKDSKIISGRTETTYAPDAYIPRTEVSRIIYRTFL